MVSTLLKYLKSFLIRGTILIAVMIIIMAVLLAIFRWTFVSYVDNYELGYIFNGLTGTIEPLERQGFIVTWPWNSVSTIDTRPMQVCISANRRVLNCKLVQFNKKGLELFLSWHGRNYASQTSVREDSTPLAEILKSYAYDGSGKEYPFLTVIRDIKTEEVSSKKPEAVK